LAEVAVGGLEYGFTDGADPDADEGPDNNMSIRFFVACKLFNPFPVNYPGGGAITLQIDKARVRMTNANPLTLSSDVNDQVWRGPDGSHSALTPGYNDMPSAGGAQPWDPWGHGSGVAQDRAEPLIPPIPPDLDNPNFTAPGRVLIPANGVATASIPPVNAGSTTNIFIPFTIVTSARHETTGLYTGPGAEMYVIIDQVRLLAVAGQGNTVRDWCSGPDMRAAFGQPNTAQFILPVDGITREGSFADGGYSPSATPPRASLVPARWVAIAKVDPRMKPGVELAEASQAWRTNTATLNATDRLAFGPDDFLSQSVPADPAYATDFAMAVYNTNLPPILFTSDSTYAMAADLGKVFTGWPWRTLRMQPQPAAEANAEPIPHIPDWVLLDMIDFTDGTKPLTTVNPNSSYVSAGATVVGFGAGLRSQLDVLTSGTAISNVASPLNPTLVRTNLAKLAGLTNGLSVSNLITQAANRQWSGASSWGGRRTNEPMEFPTTALMLPSEIVEVAGFADYAGQGDNFKLNEYRIGALFPGLSTKSRFFKIYAVGQALEGTTTQNVAATALLQTLIEVDDSTDPISITTIYQYPPPD
jgi:hypothetical protein